MVYGSECGAWVGCSSSVTSSEGRPIDLRVKVDCLSEWEINLGNARSWKMGGKRGVNRLIPCELALL